MLPCCAELPCAHSTARPPRVFQPQSRFNDLDDWHFSDIAAPIGGVGERVTTRRELAAALDCAVKRRGQFSLV
jgi:indolepyruvate decarboxylase